MASTSASKSIAPRTYQLQIEHRSGNASQVTVIIPPFTTTPNTMHIFWEAIKRNLFHKEKALNSMSLLGVRVLIGPDSGIDRHYVSGPDRTTAKPLGLNAASDELHHDLATEHYADRITVRDRIPLLAKIGRGFMILLAVGAQVGLSFIAV